jgi:hypothetical protein
MKYLSHILVGLLVFLLTYFAMNRCNTPMPVKDREKEIIIKDSIITKEVEVIKWKEQKVLIKYRTVFDTLVTIDTVLVELIKCDSIVKIDEIIIADQDTIIEKHKALIELKEKEIKREKRKTFFTKVVAGVAIVVTILLLR